MPITKATASSIAPAAKGDLVVGSATNDAAVLGVGSNDQVLTADSSTATGLKWATAGGGDYVKITSGSFSSSSSIIVNDVFSATYDYYKLFTTFTSTNSGVLRVRWRVSGSSASGANYEWTRLYTSGSTVGASGSSGQTAADICDLGGSRSSLELLITQPYLEKPTLAQGYNIYNAPTDGTDHGFYVSAYWVTTSYTGFELIPSNGTVSGDYILYGLKV